ncbi:MAG: sugar transferase [Chlorobi bacterium]|nr:sugar transferase [Chlorobiota bacterium]MCI0716200.1 sugar transferase [Chlorobiota bacterium]
MSSKKEKIFLFLSDFIFVNIAWTIYYIIRIESGWIQYSQTTSFLIPLFVVYLYWILIFSFAGLYQHWFVRSRFDEFASVVKAVSLGCFLLFFFIFLDDVIRSTKAISRLLILIYWALMVVSVGSGRILIRSFQRNLLQKGIGLRNTIIIGTGPRGKELESLVGKFPQLGYNVVGYVSTNGADEVSVLGNIKDINGIVTNNYISEVLIALEAKERDKLFEILKYCPQDKVNMKILPDTYEIVSGLAKTSQIYGVPLIEVMPGIMSYSARLLKRFLDLFIAVFLLILLMPLLLLIALLIKLTSEGTVFYTQIRVGRNGRLFKMFKFRSMIKDSEEYGPEWAGEQDSRITKIGKIIRKLYLDEVPQMINVLKNEMSLVGPRPERPHFVDMLKNEIPYYYKRLSVKPGITGWAQIKHKYDSSLDDVREKLKYDFYYIENMSLKTDFKIMINTFLVIILLKGH